MAENPNDFALVIGIKDYPNYESLTNPVNDANDFADWLREKEGGGLLSDHCKVVVSDPTDLSPVPMQIDDALEDLIALTKNQEPRRLYLFFSGHGLGIDPDNAGLCLTRWSEARMGIALSSGAYLDYLVNAGVFEEIFMLLDCCRIRAYHKGFHSPSLSDFGAGDKSKNVRRFVGYACEHTTSAYEPSLNETVSISRADNNGYFTKALLNGLRGEAVRAGNTVTAADLHNYLEIHTARLANDAGHNQKATCTSDFSTDNAPILAVIEDLVAETIVTINFRYDGLVSFSDGSNKLLKKEQVRNGTTWIETLKPGLYVLESDSAGKSEYFNVKPNTEEQDVNY